MECERRAEAATWRKSSKSGPGEGNCVEVLLSEEMIWVRDSKEKKKGTLSFSPSAWIEFIACLKKDEFSY